MADREAAEASSAAKKKAVPVWFTEKFKKLPDFYNEFFEPAETESMHTCKICKEEKNGPSNRLKDSLKKHLAMGTGHKAQNL